MGKITELFDENGTLGTGSVWVGISTAAAAALAARCRIRRVEITQSGTLTAQMIRGEFATRDTAGTLTVTSKTPQNIKPLGGPVSGLAGNTNLIGGTARSGTFSSADSGGAYTKGHPFGFNNQNGFLWVPTPEEQIEVPASTVWVVRALAAPTTLTGWTILVVLEEE